MSLIEKTAKLKVLGKLEKQYKEKPTAAAKKMIAQAKKDLGKK